MAKKIPIPKPPGGELSCSDQQMGVVRVKNGEVFATCYDPPLSGTSEDDPVAMLNWAVATITDRTREPWESVGIEEVSILESGKYSERNRRGEVVLKVRFRLPRTYQATLKRYAQREM